ncbi:MAG: TorF family putative porin [Sulfuritalea sp.]|nr:TorF family putative porin [Sulfuritalea sp.]
MNKKLVALAVAGALSSPLVAVAADPAREHTFTGNLTLASEYIYRGIGQTNRKPALQGGFDYAHRSGLYAGIWGSNISWLSDLGGISSSIELDVYGGYKGTFANDFGYDVGVLTYNYPGAFPGGFTDADTTEVYVGLGWKWLSAKYSYTVSSHIFGWVGAGGEKTRGSDYLELNAAYDLGDGWGINAHLGHQKIKRLSDASYTDWKLGVTKDVGFGTVGLAYVGTDAKGDPGQPYRNPFGKDLGKERLLLTFGKTF